MNSKKCELTLSKILNIANLTGIPLKVPTSLLSLILISSKAITLLLEIFLTIIRILYSLSIIEGRIDLK